jgi:hypothetical protein
MEDHANDSEDSSQTQPPENSGPEFLSFDKLLNLMMANDQNLVQERINDLNDKELACLKWYTGAQSDLELISCTLYSQGRARLRKDSILRHSFLHFTTQIMAKCSFNWRGNREMNKEEALEQFITLVYEVKDKQPLDYFAHCMSKGFSMRGIKTIKRVCPTLIDSYFDYFDQVYLQERINHFETTMKAVVKDKAKAERQLLKRKTPHERLTNPLTVIQIIKTVRTLRLNLCREEDFLTVWKRYS